MLTLSLIHILRAIRAALPADGIYVEEVTQVGFASRLAFPVPAPRTFLSPGYQDTLGWGYGTALGAQAAAPGRKVVPVSYTHLDVYKRQGMFCVS